MSQLPSGRQEHRSDTLTNGAFRLHPIEWNVGEAAAVIASLSLKKQQPATAAEVQAELVRGGVPLVWFDDLKVDHPAFAAIHLAAIKGLYPIDGVPFTRRPKALLRVKKPQIYLLLLWDNQLERNPQLTWR